MRLFTLLTGIIVASVISISAYAQNPQEIPVRINGADQNSVAAEYGYSKDFTTKALENKLAAAGLGKKSRKNGFTYYKEVSWPAITMDKIDVYFKVTGNSKKSAVNMLVAKGYDNFITSATDAQAILNLKNFLGSLSEDISAYQKQVILAAQQEKVAKAQRDAERSIKDAERTAKRQKREDKQKEKYQKKLDAEQQKMKALQSGN